VGVVLAVAGCAGRVLAARAIAGTYAHASMASMLGQRVAKPSHDTRWPATKRRFPADRPLDARLRKLAAGMRLAPNIGRMTQGGISSIARAQLAEFPIGSVLNGGGWWAGARAHRPHASRDVP
jgi:hypothetical protein